MNAQDQTDTPQISAAALRALTSIGAAGLFAFGLICWIAANWASFHRLTKLELVAGTLLVSALAAAVLPRVRVPALLLATAAVGGLFALIGQTYPSGADAWQLFALWAALALPFALAARHDAVWVLWTIVAGAAIGLWRLQESGGLRPQDFAPAWAMALAVAALLSPYARLQRLLGDTRWAFRLAALGAIALIAMTGFEALFKFDNSADGSFVMAAFALCVATAALAFARPLEFGVMTLAFAGVDALVIARLYKAVFDKRLEIGGAILLWTAGRATPVALSRRMESWCHARRGIDAARRSLAADPRVLHELAPLRPFGRQVRLEDLGRARDDLRIGEFAASLHGSTVQHLAHGGLQLPHDFGGQSCRPHEPGPDVHLQIRHAEFVEGRHVGQLRRPHLARGRQGPQASGRDHRVHRRREAEGIGHLPADQVGDHRRTQLFCYRIPGKCRQ